MSSKQDAGDRTPFDVEVAELPVVDRSGSEAEDDLVIEPQEFDPVAAPPGKVEVKPDARGLPTLQLPKSDPGAARVIPEFARGKVPKDLVFPRGIDAFFIKVPGAITHARHKGDRVCIIWELSEGDEKLAYGRSLNDPSRAVAELSKQMVRAFDGHRADWSGTGPGNIDQFWREIGPKGRNLMQMLHSRINVMGMDDMRDFFASSIVPVYTG